MGNENRNAQKMRVLRLRAIQAKKFKATTDLHRSRPVGPNMLKQVFEEATLNQKGIIDITYIWTDEGWLYLAVVMNLYS